jgi:hypothetical protein
MRSAFRKYKQRKIKALDLSSAILPRGQLFVVNFFKFFGLILIRDESGLR